MLSELRQPTQPVKVQSHKPSPGSPSAKRMKIYSGLVALVVLIAGCNMPVRKTAPPMPPMPHAKDNRLRIFKVAGTANQTNITLAWTASSDTNVIGYRLYQGLASQTYTTTYDAGGQTNITVPLIAGMNFFAATAYTGQGLESAFSNEVKYNPTNVVKVVYIDTFVETNSMQSLSNWASIAQFPRVAVTNPPGDLFFRTRLTITQTNVVNP